MNTDQDRLPLQIMAEAEKKEILLGIRADGSLLVIGPDKALAEMKDEILTNEIEILSAIMMFTAARLGRAAYLDARPEGLALAVGQAMAVGKIQGEQEAEG